MSRAPDDTLDDLRRSNADLQRRLANAEQRLEETATERDETLQRETATAEVLHVINSSFGDLAPVFDAILEKAVRFCAADGGYFLRYQDGTHTFAAGHGLQPDFAAFLSGPSQPEAGSPAALAVRGAPYIHIVDLKDDDYYRTPRRRAIVDLGGVGPG